MLLLMQSQLYSGTCPLSQIQYFVHVTGQLQVIRDLICPPAATTGWAKDAYFNSRR